MSLSSIQLEAFAVLAQTHNFTRAAEKLHISQSALSQRIANLEDELGTTLFLRDRAGLKLTETGHELLRYCQMKDGLESEFLTRLHSQGSQGLSGWVRIGGFSSIMSSIVLPSLAKLVENEPRLTLQTHTRELRELPDLLRRGEIDYMLLDHEHVREDLETLTIGEEQYVLTEREGYRGEDVFLDHDEEDTLTISYFKATRRKAPKLRRHYVDDIHGIIEGVRNGIGRAILPLHLVRSEKNLRIVSPDVILKVPVFLHFYRRAYYSRLHERIVSALSINSLSKEKKS